MNDDDVSRRGCFPETPTLVLILKRLWGRLTNLRRIGNPPAAACAIGLQACRRRWPPPQFPSQETLP
jgi:hypothetical protein